MNKKLFIDSLEQLSSEECRIIDGGDRFMARLGYEIGLLSGRIANGLDTAMGNAVANALEGTNCD